MDTDKNPLKPNRGQGVPGAGDHKRVTDRAPATPAEVRALLFSILDVETTNKMIYSLRRKAGKGQLGVLEFIFSYLIGKPAVNVHHDMDGALKQFMEAWSQLANSEQTLLPAPDYAGLTIEADEPATLDTNDPPLDSFDSDIIPIV